MDSTSDVGHINQLTLVYRYMEEPKPVERFVNFKPNICGHKTADMFKALVDFLVKHNEYSLCFTKTGPGMFYRDQSYDNASSMEWPSCT